MNNLDKLTLEEILELRIKDLKLEFTSEQKKTFQDLFLLLRQNNIDWKPHIWMSDEWFSPDGVSGFAVPFVLAHKKLIQLEVLFLGECEGRNKSEFIKLCCHETGHAIDNAYKLRLNKTRQNIFGLTSKKYPNSYKPKPESKNYISFLGDHYAQAHPDEDWAETFGYFITRGKDYDKKHNSVVLDKLNCMEGIIKSLPNKNHKNNTQRTPNNIKNDCRTVRQYLIEKRQNLKKNRANFYTKKINNQFSKKVMALPIHRYIRENQKKLVQEISNSTGKDIWTINKSLNDLKEECKKQKYTLKYNQRDSFNQVKNLLISHIDEYVQKGQTRIYM
jgi:hypothetical protein